jgi:predicted lipoprotein with Yx(FWY)xxD motif
VITAVGAVSALALVLLGVAVAGAGGQPAAAAGAGVTLKTATIGGVTVLTNANGLTLYWFAPDTPTSSKCTGSCAAYWPPVTGTARAGPGVTGRLGTINRPDGAVQGHDVVPRAGALLPEHRPDLIEQSNDLGAEPLWCRGRADRREHPRAGLLGTYLIGQDHRRYHHVWRVRQPNGLGCLR